MVKILKVLIDRVYEESHLLIEGKIHREYEEKGITIYFHQDQNKITLTALKIDTQYQIDLTAKKYNKLFDKYREIGKVTPKYKERMIVIDLINSTVIQIENYNSNRGSNINTKTVSQNKRVYGYCRVSSRGQSDNNSFEQQESEIFSKYREVKFYKEQFTGATIDRPVLNNLIGDLKEGDTLVVTKLDRLARTTKEGIEIIQELLNKGITVEVLNVGILDNTPMGNFFISVLLAVAEMERAMIVERTQTGKAIAKTKSGFKEGRPKKFKETILESALKNLTVNGGSMSYKEVEQNYGISKSTLIRAQRKRIKE